MQVIFLHQLQLTQEADNRRVLDLHGLAASASLQLTQGDNVTMNHWDLMILGSNLQEVTNYLTPKVNGGLVVRTYGAASYQLLIWDPGGLVFQFARFEPSGIIPCYFHPCNSSKLDGMPWDPGGICRSGLRASRNLRGRECHGRPQVVRALPSWALGCTGWGQVDRSDVAYKMDEAYRREAIDQKCIRLMPSSSSGSSAPHLMLCCSYPKL